MQVRLLGSVEVVFDGTVRAVPGAAERALLALLAGAGGRVVGTDRLIDALWGDDLPANPRNALQLRVSKLRKVVGEALVAVPPGYRLEIVPDEVDSSRFERLVAQRRYAEALALWRGPPLEEFAEQSWAGAEAARLEELRATAVEEQIELRLAAGEHAELVAELDGLVARDPLRERLRGQLMLALYRSGRTADALAAYQDLRRRLDSELGLTPSSALRRLEESILRQDAALDGAAAPSRNRRSLPNPLAPMIGRDTELARLLDLVPERRLVTLTGPGGAGKTTLAVAAARRLEQDFPDGVWFVPLAQVTDPARVPAAVADTLGLNDTDAAATRRLVTAWLAPRHALLVLDNCEHLADAVAGFVERLVTSAGDRLRVLATSREALAVRGEIQLLVPPLALADAVALFAERATAVRADFAAAEAEDDIRRICERLDRMPLAIELAAARVTTLSSAVIADRLADRFGLLTVAPRTAEARHRTLRATVDWSHALLDAREQRLFRRLGVFAGGWTLSAAEAVCGMGSDTLDVLAQLVDRSLVVADGDRFRMLETIRTYAEERLGDDEDAPEVRQRHAEFFTRLSEAAEAGLRGAQQGRVLAQLRADEANLLRALDWGRRHAAADPDLAVRLAGGLGWYWYVGRQVDGRAELTAALDAAPHAAGVVRARALQALSLALRPAGCIVHPSPTAAAAARDSLVLFRAADEPVRAALSELLLAVEAVAGDDVATALDTVARARTVLERHDDAWGAGLADFVEMEIQLHQGSTDRALVLGAEASERFDRLGDEWGRSAVRLHLGAGLRLVGRTDQAEAVLDRAVALSRDTGLPNNLARAFAELGEVALHRGEPDEADRWLAECDRVACELADDGLRALVAVGRGTAARLRAEPAGARMRFDDALALARPAGLARTAARAAIGAAAADLDRGQADPVGLVDALEIARDIGDMGVLASGLEQRARSAAAARDAAGVGACLVEAATLRRQHRRPRSALERRDVAGLGALDASEDTAG